jgi:coenzyme F420 hydrogenase subunit beta
MSTRQDGFGTYLSLVVSQATDPQILEMAQNGGAVTAMLVCALNNRTIDGAIISAKGTERPLYPIPMLATSAREIIQNAGTRYTYSANVQVLSEAMRQNMKAVAFVGTPCQISTVRRMQQKGDARATRVKLLIGLMCSRTYDYRELMIDHIQNTLGIDLHDIRKIDIKRQMIISTKTGQKTIPLEDLKKFARKPCKACQDFSSEKADISAGSLGLRYSTFTIIRTHLGEEVFRKAEEAHAVTARPVSDDEPALKLLIKLSKQKHNRFVTA